MRNMAFFLTTAAIRDHTKTHTIRANWQWLTPGTHLAACVKTRGLKLGQRPTVLAEIIVDTVAVRPLDSITQEEVIAEGFPTWTPTQFIQWLSLKIHCQPTAPLTFISFHYAEE